VQQLANVQPNVERETIQSKGHAARVAQFQSKYPRGFEAEPRVHAVFACEVIPACRRQSGISWRRLTRSWSAFLSSGAAWPLFTVLRNDGIKAIEHLLVTERDNLIDRASQINMPRDLEIRPFFKMGNSAQRDKVARDQFRVGNSIWSINVKINLFSCSARPREGSHSDEAQGLIGRF
jgi:hypothetical protein